MISHTMMQEVSQRKRPQLVQNSKKCEVSDKCYLLCSQEHGTTEKPTTGNVIITFVVLNNDISFYDAERDTTKAPTSGTEETMKYLVISSPVEHATTVTDMTGNIIITSAVLVNSIE